MEGLLGLHTPSLRERYDVSVYLDTPEPLRHRWKVARDTAKRGYSATQVHELLERRESVSEKYIRPQREHADMVVRFHPDSDYTDYEHLHATVDDAPYARSAGSARGDRLMPARGVGAPTHARPGDGEALEIDGGISAEQAAEVERELWSRSAGARAAAAWRARGNFTENGTTRHSHALAIAQLLLTYPVLRARLAQGAFPLTMTHLLSTVTLACALAGALPAQRPTGFLDRTVALGALTMKYQVYVPNSYDGHRSLPVILFMHGSGERGSDGLKQTQVGMPAQIRLASRLVRRDRRDAAVPRRQRLSRRRRAGGVRCVREIREGISW